MTMKERPFGSNLLVISTEKMLYGVRLWEAIRKEWDILSNRLAFQVDNGQRG